MADDAIMQVRKARARQLSEHRPLTPGELRSLPAPHPRWWQLISQMAKSGKPIADGIVELVVESAVDPSIPEFPAWLEDWDHRYPALTQNETLALVEKFLLCERGALLAGVAMHPYHYLALSAYYCARREPFEALTECVRAGYLDQAGGGFKYQACDLTWPLVTTQQTIARIDALVIAIALPAVAKAERHAARLRSAVPTLFSLLGRAVRGAGDLIRRALGPSS